MTLIDDLWEVEDDYRVHWIVDNLPAATRFITGYDDDNGPGYAYERGYLLGFVGGRLHYETVIFYG